MRVLQAQQIPLLLKELDKVKGVMLAVFFGLLMKEYDIEPDDDYTTCEKIVHNYLGDPNPDRHSSPFIGRRINHSLFYLYNWLESTYLTPPCTTVLSERLFSTL